ncbi:thiamine phosphate synthase [Thalassotalea euphylliae]|uniref:thiamine phosphate synthase n=1 Tax=Thalassotalea euphylliae TaxID=1655234 RepID=UPI0036406586
MMLVKNQESKQTSKPIIWTISGSDCSGGAGVAADIKTIHGLGGEVCTLITANTSQNSHQLVAVNPVDINILSEQAETLLADKPPTAIKIGLLANDDQVVWLTHLLSELKKLRPELMVVYDPVASASVGGKFSELSFDKLNRLFPLINVITPNTSELKALSNVEDEVHAVAQLLDQSIEYVVVKGGHSVSDICCDSVFFHRENNELDWYQVQSQRVNTSYSHGGGCAFASAMTTFLSLGYLMRDALTLTKAFINQGLSQHRDEVEYYGAFAADGFPTNAEYFPAVCSPFDNQQLCFPSLDLNGQKLGLYPVIDSLEWLQKLVPLGLNIIQLRLKNLSMEEVELQIVEAIQMTKGTNTRLFINDYWQLAIKHGAYGVHLGQEDLVDADLDAIANAGIRLGISTHGCYEFILAKQLQPSYLAIGAIFPTVTKDMTGQIQGVDNLRHMLALKDDVPVVAIGGINEERAKVVAETGVDSIAVVTAITHAKNYKTAVNRLNEITL